MRGVAVLVLFALASAGCFDFGAKGVEPKDYLTSERYTKWVIEVDYSSGERPDPALLNFLRGKLAPLVHKDVVEFRLDEALQDGDTTWSDGELQSFAAQHQGTKTGGDTVVTHLLFLSGRSEHDSGDQRVLGAAYGHGLIALFSKSIKASCDSALPLPGLCTPEPFFRAVAMHEFGHVLGLVDNGVPMVRDHEADDCAGSPDSHHSSNEDSVMYCQVESSAVVPLFGNNPPTDFDADDRADLRAAGGK